MMNEMEEEVIDIRELLKVIKKRFWVVILITLLTTGLGYYQASKMQVYYRASAKVFVGKREAMVDYYDKKEMEYYTSFMNTFNEVIKIDDFLTETLTKHKINLSPNQVKGSLGFYASENTPIFTVTYTSAKEEGAVEILTAICEEFNLQAKTIFPETMPQIIDSAKVYPVYPDKNKKILIYALVGIALSVGLIVGLYIIDDTIKNKDKLQKVLPIPVLGEVPKHERFFKEGRK